MCIIVNVFFSFRPLRLSFLLMLSFSFRKFHFSFLQISNAIFFFVSSIFRTLYAPIFFNPSIYFPVFRSCSILFFSLFVATLQHRKTGIQWKKVSNEKLTQKIIGKSNGVSIGPNQINVLNFNRDVFIVSLHQKLKLNCCILHEVHIQGTSINSFRQLVILGNNNNNINNTSPPIFMHFKIPISFSFKHSMYTIWFICVLRVIRIFLLFQNWQEKGTKKKKSEK